MDGWDKVREGKGREGRLLSEGGRQGNIYGEVAVLRWVYGSDG